ncbi:WhiB family transcriptional regulator [Streptomyces purpureus]|uniref:Transcriptional regulator WhiB n=1 Tax=Streptomyces purpureus TaxID=1951 RepID=A0A918H883_9ACTN|nr:WhiB family transcriptional regulator [Streptomyces purpureus]GGT43588.1 hypothetical protein GCM10014713_41630 [Streptomyces purpureus]
MSTSETPAAGMTTLPGAGTNWKADGRCREVDPDLFFPEVGTGQSSAAKAVCLSCEVRLECLEYALTHGEQGVWGGTTEGQRRAIRRTRRDQPEREPEVEDAKSQRNSVILQLTHAGLSAAEIADRLGCAARTVTRVRTSRRQEAAA